MEVVFREIVVLILEVDKVVDEVTNMEVDKGINMVAEISNDDFSDMTGDY